MKSELPDISKRKTEKLTNMNALFYKYSSLISLHEISNWNTTNVISLDYVA